jgi:hypothetical protein
MEAIQMIKYEKIREETKQNKHRCNWTINIVNWPINTVRELRVAYFNWSTKSVKEKRVTKQLVILDSTLEWYWNDGLIRCSMKWEWLNQSVVPEGRRTALEWPINLVMSTEASPNQSVRLVGLGSQSFNRTLHTLTDYSVSALWCDRLNWSIDRLSLSRQIFCLLEQRLVLVFYQQAYQGIPKVVDLKAGCRRD